MKGFFMTDDEFDSHALIFFKEYKDVSDRGFEMNFESSALDYVKGNDDFREKDVVEAGCLVSSLQRNEYIDYIERKKDGRYHKITDKGIEYLNAE